MMGHEESSAIPKKGDMTMQPWPRRATAGFVLCFAFVAGVAAAGDPPASPPFSAPRGNFGGWTTSRGRFTFTADGRVGTTVGPFTFYDGGLTATRNGGVTAWTDGRWSARFGRKEIFSDGVIGVPTRGGTVYTPGFTQPPRRAASHHAGHPDAGR